AGVLCRLWSSVDAPEGRMPGLTISVDGNARRQNWIASPDAMMPSHPASSAACARVTITASTPFSPPASAGRSDASRLDNTGTVRNFGYELFRAARAAHAVRMAGRGIDSLNVSSSTFMLTHASMTAAIVFEISPGSFRSTNTRLVRRACSRSGRPPVMNSCRPTLKNEMLSRRSTLASASSTVGTSSATMIRSLPVRSATRPPSTRLPCHHVAVAGRAHAAHEHPGSRIDQDRLHRSDAFDVAEVQLMPFRRQRVLDGFREHRRRQELALDVVRIVRIAEAVADHGRLLQR